MFYVNNEQVKGIYLNDISLNYLAYGFGKIIPEDRNAEQLNLNLAYKYLNHYRIEYGTVKDGYENALVSPRIDEPDPRGVFCTPFTYYYSGNIVSTKNVPVLITDGNCALSNALVYNDMNINGAINHFASNTDFQGHNINVSPEKECFGPLLNYEMLNNCSNFDLNISTRFSKTTYPTLYNCNNFSGNYRYVGNQDIEYPGFRYFLRRCRDGIFNIDCTNMHGGGIFNIDDTNMSSGGNVRKYFNFIGIQSCENMNVNITGSSWQVWPHDYSYSSNCNINTYNVISGFSYINDCNFNVVLPKDSKPEMTSGFAFLSNAENCNYNLYATDVNLFNYRSGVGHANFFENLNNCNLNLQVNNTVSFDHSFGGNFNNCNIKFDNIKADLSTFGGWSNLRNCNISGNVEVGSMAQAFIEYCDGLNVNLNAAKSSSILPMWRCHNVKGNFVAGDMTYVYYSNYTNLKVSGGRLCLVNINHSYFRVNNTTFNCRSVNNTEIYSEGGSTSITGLDNCYNLKLSGLTFNTTALGDCLLENVYNSNIKFGTANTYYRLWRVENCIIDGFPRALTYVNKCVFKPFNMRQVGLSEVGTWNNVWPHNKIAGIRSTDNISNCRIYANGRRTDGSTYFSNLNNMQTSFGNYYNGFVTANLPKYNMNIKLNVDCNTLNLGIFLAGPPHGFQNATISADNIYAKGNMPDAYVQVTYDTKIYCANYCNACFGPYVDNYNSVLQPVILINNYQHSSTGACIFHGGLARIGRLNYRGHMTVPLELYNGACMFINNTELSDTTVDNALLFLGTNVYVAGDITVRNGGRVRNAANLTNDDIRFIDRGHLCWNFTDSGPWGPQSLFDFCINV